jgi:hypothetical protein
MALLVLSTACGGSEPTSPTGRSEPTAVPTPTSPLQPNFPPLSGPSRIFTFDHELSYRVMDYTKNSRFVLYDNGAFVLQYAICNCGGEYRGRYTEANGVITFEWEGWSVAGPWGATGTLQGATLTVQYNLIMGLSDFEDAAYLRTQ